MYDPTLGRFLQQDPIGDEMAPGAAPVVLEAEQAARDKTTETFGWPHRDDRSLWQMAVGSNMYEFVNSNPVNGTDPSGMDRNVTDGGGGHHGISVDTWALVNGKWVKTGTVQYDFSADYRFGPLILGALTCGCPGKVRGGGPGSATDPVVGKTIPSSPQADNTLKANLDAAKINPPIYHIGFNNCNDFAMDHIMDGINVPPSPPPRRIPIGGWGPAGGWNQQVGSDVDSANAR